MQYEIKRGAAVIATVRPEGSITTKIMGEELVSMTFTLANNVVFKTNDTVVVYGNTYYLLNEPIVEKRSTKEYRYQLQFAGIKYELSKVQLFFPDADNNLTLSEFSITGTANQMLNLVVQNANRVQSGWSLGVIDDLDGKQVDFNGHNCLTAISKIAEEFDAEYWIDGDKTIHLTERKAISGLSLEYGKNKGLLSISRTPYDNSNIVTRLYAVGSENNIPADYRNYTKRLQMPVAYLEKNVAKYGVIEHVQTFEDIYPKRIGTVTSVNSESPLQFTDANIDFDLNETDANGTVILINDIPAKITFNSGQLAGYTFEIKKHGYNTATKTFELIPNKDEKDLTVPSELLRPSVGDTYVITDIAMPQSYITNAEILLQNEAQAYLDENSEQRNKYSVAPDPFYFEEINANIVLGNTINFKDVDFSLDDDLRVVSLTKDLQNQYNVSFDIAERAVLSTIIREYIEEEKKNTALLKTLTYNADMARRSYLFAKEFHDNVFDGEGYFDADRIKPLSIETKMLSVGSRMQQFNLPDVSFTVSEDNTTVSNTTGTLVHLTLEDTPREWNIPQNTVTGIGTAFHYIYIKAQKIGSNASVYISTEQIMVDNDPDWYYFEAGYLSSVIDNVRRIKTTYGFTQVSPSEISTGRIASPNGNNYIELLQDNINIKANVTFESNSPAFQQVSDSLEIGGRNLLSIDNVKGDRGAIVDTGFYMKTGEVKLFVPEESTTAGIRIDKISLEPLKPYVLSYKYKKESGILTTIYGHTSLGYANKVKLVVDGVLVSEAYASLDSLFVADDELEHSVEYYFITPADFSTNDSIWVQPNKGANPAVEVSIFDLKLENGNKVTGWSPAPEDITKEIVDTSLAAEAAAIAEAEAKVNLAKIEVEAYADGIVSAEEDRAIADAQNKLQAAKDYADAQDNLKETTIKVYADGKADEAEQAAIAEAEAKVNLAKTEVEAYADGIVSVEEARAIADAQNKLQAAKDYADAQDNLKETTIKAYADGKADAAEQAAIAEAEAKVNLAKTEVEAYADGIVSAEEARAISDAQTKLDEAKAYTDSIEVGSSNLITVSNVFTTATVIVDKSLFITSGVIELQVLEDDFNGGIYIKNLALKPLQDYVLSYRYKKKSGILNTFGGHTAPTYSNKQKLVVDGVEISSQYNSTSSVFVDDDELEHHVEYYFKTPSNPLLTDSIYIQPNRGNNSAVEVSIFDLKLERGNKPTDWTPATEDVQESIDNAIQEAQNAAADALNALNTAQTTANKTNFLQTDIDGNVISTGTMQVGALNNANAGVTGVTDAGANSVRFFAGSDYAGKNNAPFRVLDDGSIFSTKGSIGGVSITQNGLGAVELVNGGLLAGNSIWLSTDGLIVSRTYYQDIGTGTDTQFVPVTLKALISADKIVMSRDFNGTITQKEYKYY
ncbi:phage tail protein [Tenacibaculum aestuarii]|uniref:phage tail protein n=1 Tax=Tenacibaculum aestuarii TaxID=362781 RepID=UPI003895F471